MPLAFNPMSYIRFFVLLITYYTPNYGFLALYMREMVKGYYMYLD